MKELGVEEVKGRSNRHRVLVYSLSTCVHCKQVKQFLRDNNVEFEHKDVDLCSKSEQQEILMDILKRGRHPSFPKIIIDDKTMITGFNKD